MAEPTERQIKARAFKLWEQAGQPVDREEEFCRQAEQLLRDEDKSIPSPPLVYNR